MNRQTTHAKNNEVPRNWVQVDATDKVLGRLATEIAMVLMGKNKPEYTPHHDVGDFVVVLNCDKIKITGKKLDQKHLRRFSGHPSGQKLTSYRDVLADKPERLIENAVRRMLPKNKLGARMITKLKVYAGDDHPHAAQNPQPLELQSA
ncbi:MAG: 50S ribosomal protein L13 [Phycisphaerales bacterium JB063]